MGFGNLGLMALALRRRVRGDKDWEGKNFMGKRPRVVKSGGEKDLGGKRLGWKRPEGNIGTKKIVERVLKGKCLSRF